MKKLILLLILPLIFVACMRKELFYEVTGEVNGIVLDENDKPIKGAIITLMDRETLTNRKGFFVINNLQVGGNPKYQVYIEKDGYSSQVVEADFETTINVEGTGGGNGDVPLNHAVVSVKVKMGTLICIKGSLKLPSNITLSPNDKIEMKTDLKINESYDSTINLYNIESEIDSNLNFIIRNVPKLGTFEKGGSTEKILKELTINLYINGAKKPNYTTSIENIDLTKYLISSSDEENSINLESLELTKLYKIYGFVYQSADRRGLLSNAIVVLSKGDETVDRVLADSTGKYTFEGIESGKNYKLKLLSLDTDNNGDYDYMEKDDFPTFSIENSQINDKVYNLWYDKAGSYVISGVVYAGNKKDVPVGGAKVVLWSDDGIRMETTTNGYGGFFFNNITRKTVYIIAEDLDSDSNGIINFEGYDEGDASSLNTRLTITNTSFTNIAEKRLYMKVNDEEPNYNIHLRGSNFFSVNSSGSVYNQRAIEVSDSIILTFDKAISQNILDSMIARKVDIVTLTNISTGGSVEVAISLDPVDAKNLIIDPTSILDAGTYRLQVSTELNVELGFNYGIKNTINTDILTSLVVEVE